MEIDKLVEEFRKIDTSDYPDFDELYKIKKGKVLLMGLWVLCVAKDELEKRSLFANEISEIIVTVKEYPVNTNNIIQAFKNADHKILVDKSRSETSYEIMKPGRDHLFKFAQDGFMFLFEPGKPFASKAILSEKVIKDLKGTLKIFDAYCGLETLDFLKTLKSRKIKFLTVRRNIENKNTFFAGVEDLKGKAPNIEIRHYNFGDIHDRYIISSDAFVILGHSIKNLGEKLTSAVKIKKDNFKEPHKTLNQFFDKKWKDAEPINQ